MPTDAVRQPLPTRSYPSFDARKIFAFVAMIFGMFMAILDIQIVSASLSEIQAGLSASADEISWVQTSYLVAEVIMIPLSGFLSRTFSTRYMFAASAAGFTLMSFMCATSSTLTEMIVWRALQGFVGGGMIPAVFAAAFTIFPKNKQAVVTPIIGLVATLAPTIGPTLGGLLTDTFSWHWLFLVNIIPGLLVTLATWFLVDFDKPNLSLLSDFDWGGLIGMAAFLGALEYMLEEGPSKSWFESELIVIALLVSILGAALFFWRAFTAKSPIVDLTAFGDRNFWTGSILSLTMGIGLYGLTYLYPVFLARVRGYSALQIGETMFVSGIAMFLTAPIAGFLSTRLDLRIMIVIGFVGSAMGTLAASLVTKDWGFWELMLPQILRGISLMFCIVPITSLALGTLPPHQLKNASGLFNLTRNFGGAVGLALINTMMNDRMDLHLARLHERVAWGRVAAEETLANLTRVYAALGSDATLAATRRLSLLVRREALVMAMGDVFIILSLLYLALVSVTLLMRAPRPLTPEAGGH
ncbi:MAG: family efflux transporter permease subunit [Hyphomicrobiales bacterium]|nr:family efflux transporter permease subunit [Hyphomicrobiales bacterium]